mmetsp:Transcript_24509/g.44321  ORF Transcript_24509/g.44321 Transcript_24509/m.44321 type:complete len:204 (-) Transcript_24509:403-1014(-)
MLHLAQINMKRAFTNTVMLATVARTTGFVALRPGCHVVSPVAIPNRAFIVGDQIMSRPSFQSYSIINTRRFSSSVNINNIGKEDLVEILEDFESVGREESGYVVLDVRGPEEIAGTGNLSPSINNLPLPFIMEKNAFKLSEEDFEEEFGFAKPQMDETLVFTCKAGIRSMHAAQLARMAGYSNLVNYVGGSMEWFSGKDDFQF